MNTPTLIVSFATVVLGGVSLTGNNKILGLELEGPVGTPEATSGQSGERNVGIYELSREGALPRGVSRRP